MCWPRSACCTKKSRNMLVRVDGRLGPGVTAKDIVLA
jgi:homoaconitase/3-isopropylmalate dehydratase large subunit